MDDRSQAEELRAVLERMRDESNQDRTALIAIQEKQKRIEDALRKSESRLRALIENAPDGVLILDDNGRFIEANESACQMTGYSEKELMKMSIRDLLSEESIEDGLVHFRRLMDSGRATGDLWHRCKDQSRRCWTVSAVRLSEDRVLGFIKDITAIRTLEKESSQQKEEMIRRERLATLGTLVAGVAHEINNPAHIVMMNSSVFQAILDDLVPVLDDIALRQGDFMIGKLLYSQLKPHLFATAEGFSVAGRRIAGIVQSLNEFANPETTGSPVESVNINDVVRKSIDLLSMFIRQRTHNLSTKYGEGLPEIRGGRPRKLEQVMINLLMNSCQALSGPDKAVTVTTAYDAGTNAIVVTIEDEGCGIPASIVSKIKEPFFTTKRGQGGTGLGLSISDSIIREHRGKLEYDSVEGKGTAVRVILPLDIGLDGV